MELKNLLLASSAALALSAASTAEAGSYLTVFGGANFQADVDGHATYTATYFGLTTPFAFGYYHVSVYATVNVSAELESGFVLGVAYGRDFLAPYWRWELELAYRENQLEDITRVVGSASKYVTGSALLTFFHFYSSFIPILTGITTTYGPYSFGPYTTTVDGSVSFFSIMTNFWYDFNVVDNWEAFVGAGIGIAQANVNGVEIGSSYYALDVVDGSDWVFAYQFGVGAGYTLDNGVRFSAQYRYFGTEEAEIDGAHLEGESSAFLFGISFPLGN